MFIRYIEPEMLHTVFNVFWNVMKLKVIVLANYVSNTLKYSFIGIIKT